MDASCGRGERALARYKSYDYRQMKLIPVDFDSQILPGTFEYTLSYWIEHKLDLSQSMLDTVTMRR